MAKNPGVTVTEVSNIDKRFEGASTSISGFFGVTKRGPIGKAMLVTGIDEFDRIFGGPIAGEPLRYTLDGFFKNEGDKAYITRAGHYISAGGGDLAADAASADAAGEGIAAYATFLGSTDVTALPLLPADSLGFDIDGSGVQTATIDATPAIFSAGVGAFLIGDVNNVGYVKVNGGVAQFIDLSGVATGVSNYVIALNAAIEQVFVEDNAGDIRVTTDREGSSASIEFINFGSSFASNTGLTASAVSSVGPNNIINSDAVTFSEIKTIIEEAVKTTTAGDKLLITQDPVGRLILTATNGLPGATSIIDLSAGSQTLIDSLGLSLLGSQNAASTAVGSVSASVTSIKISAGYRGDLSQGLDGNLLSVIIEDAPIFISAGAGNDLAADATVADLSLSLAAVAGISKGSILKLTDNAISEFVVVSKVETNLVGSSVQHTVTLESALVNSFAKLTTIINSVEHKITVLYKDLVVESWPNLTMNSDSERFVATILNDVYIGSAYVTVEDQGISFPGNILVPLAETDLTGGSSEVAGFVPEDISGTTTGDRSGLHSFDKVQDLNLLAAPPSLTTNIIPANTFTHNALLLYCESRSDCFAILDAPSGLERQYAVNYRLNVMGADSRWGAMYWPHIYVSDPLGTGSEPSILIPPSGAVMGKYAYVDGVPTPEGGVASSPAGPTHFGKVNNVLGLEFEADKEDHAALNEAGVNVILRKARGGAANSGLYIMGARTLSSDPAWRYINIRRVMLYLANTLRVASEFALFRNNDFRLRGIMDTRITEFLKQMHADGQLKGRKAVEAYYVTVDESNNPPEEVALGNLNVKVGVAVKTPAEFIDISLAKTQGVLVVEGI